MSEGAEQARQAGIPGIKYLDGSSRSAGEGTRNFVVFDENLPTIISRNGEKVGGVVDTSFRGGHQAPTRAMAEIDGSRNTMNDLADRADRLFVEEDAQR